MHFRCYRMRIVCDECGSTCVLHQPLPIVRCAACGEHQSVPVDFLRDIFTFKYGFHDPTTRHRLDAGELFDALMIGAAGQFFAKHGLRQPVCQSCGVPTDLSRLPPGSTFAAPCPRCAAIMTTRPADDWLRSLAPNAIQIFVPKPVDSVATQRPVSLSCPDCGGKLKAGPTDRRIVTCGFCETDVFLPEEIWRTFHPVVKRPTFYIVFNAPREA